MTEQEIRRHMETDFSSRLILDKTERLQILKACRLLQTRNLGAEFSMWMGSEREVGKDSRGINVALRHQDALNDPDVYNRKPKCLLLFLA